MRIDSCRSCKSNIQQTEMDLGVLHNTGFFPDSRETPVDLGRLDLVRCTECDLVQLGEELDNTKLFSSDNYGYNSSLNESMSSHLNGIAREILNLTKHLDNPKIVDIGSNDGTLLNHCLELNEKIQVIGVDPNLHIWQECYNERIIKVNGFFSGELLKSNGIENIDIVTSIAMFYDLQDPMRFASDVHSALKVGGLWIMEQSYLPSMIQRNSFDTICHEHLEYYSLFSLKYILENSKFAIKSVELNNSNGGSIRVVAQKLGLSKSLHTGKIEALLKKETELRAQDFSLSKFMRSVNIWRSKFRELIEEVVESGQVLVGLGASTKGNTLLQYCGLTANTVVYIEEINPRKHNHFTPGSLIPIYVENTHNLPRPNVKLVLPWHFKQNIIQKQDSFISTGGRLIIPLPNLHVISGK